MVVKKVLIEYQFSQTVIFVSDLPNYKVNISCKRRTSAYTATCHQPLVQKLGATDHGHMPLGARHPLLATDRDSELTPNWQIIHDLLVGLIEGAST